MTASKPKPNYAEIAAPLGITLDEQRIAALDSIVAALDYDKQEGFTPEFRGPSGLTIIDAKVGENGLRIADLHFMPLQGGPDRGLSLQPPSLALRNAIRGFEHFFILVDAGVISSPDIFKGRTNLGTSLVKVAQRIGFAALDENYIAAHYDDVRSAILDPKMRSLEQLLSRRIAPEAAPPQAAGNPNRSGGCSG